MKVLLKAGAEGPAATSILVLPREAETTFETLSGEAEHRGFVAEVEKSVVSAAISAAVMNRGYQGRSAETLFEATESMARALNPCEVGSRIGLRFLGRSCSLDVSQAKSINRAPGLDEGDQVTIGPPVAETFVNARGCVISIRGEAVQVELDAGDRERIERSTIRRLPPVTIFPRVCVERADSDGLDSPLKL